MLFTATNIRSPAPFCLYICFSFAFPYFLFLFLCLFLTLSFSSRFCVIRFSLYLSVSLSLLCFSLSLSLSLSLSFSLSLSLFVSLSFSLDRECSLGCQGVVRRSLLWIFIQGGNEVTRDCVSGCLCNFGIYLADSPRNSVIQNEHWVPDSVSQHLQRCGIAWLQTSDFLTWLQERKRG